MPYGGVPTSREIITKMLDDGTLQALYEVRDTEKEIAACIGVAYSTFRELKKQIPAFSTLSTRTREMKFDMIVNAMRKNALGYDYEETEVETDAEGNIKKRQTFTRHKAPDINSQKILLTNIKKAEGNQPNPNPRIAGWSNKAEEALEIKAEGGINLLLDASVQSVLEALSGN